MSESHPLPEILYVPDILKNWPWPRTINPHHDEIDKETKQWFLKFNAFSEEQQQIFYRGEFGLLSSLVYPNATPEVLRLGTNAMYLFFLIDEYTDVESAEATRVMADILCDAIDNPSKPRPEGEPALGEVVRDYWYRAIQVATKPAQKHFVESFKDYLDSVVTQSANRDTNKHLTAEEYFIFRRQNIGSRPVFSVSEFYLNLPDEAFYHPTIKELEFLSTDLIITTNDVASFNKEQAIGDARDNILSIIMHQHKCSYDEAAEWVVKYSDDVQARFIETLKEVPSFGPEVDRELQEYIEHLANWPRGNETWNFECGRYFGSKGLEIQKSHYVKTMSKLNDFDRGHREHIHIPLVEVET